MSKFCPNTFSWFFQTSEAGNETQPPILERVSRNPNLYKDFDRKCDYPSLSRLYQKISLQRSDIFAGNDKNLNKCSGCFRSQSFEENKTNRNFGELATKLLDGNNFFTISTVNVCIEFSFIWITWKTSLVWNSSIGNTYCQIQNSMIILW